MVCSARGPPQFCMGSRASGLILGIFWGWAWFEGLALLGLVLYTSPHRGANSARGPPPVLHGFASVLFNFGLNFEIFAWFAALGVPPVLHGFASVLFNFGYILGLGLVWGTGSFRPCSVHIATHRGKLRSGSPPLGMGSRAFCLLFGILGGGPCFAWFRERLV